MAVKMSCLSVFLLVVTPCCLVGRYHSFVMYRFHFRVEFRCVTDVCKRFSVLCFSVLEEALQWALRVLQMCEESIVSESQQYRRSVAC